MSEGHINCITILLFIILTGYYQITNASEFSQTFHKSSGSLTFNETDFPVEILNYPSAINELWRARFRENRVNRVFMHTFSNKVKAGCKVSEAKLKLVVKNLASIRNNDTISFVDNGLILFTKKVWNRSEPTGKTKELIFNLASLPKTESILDTLNDGDFSFYIEDDTSVGSVTLFRTLSGSACRK